MENLFNYFTTDNVSGKKCNDKWLSVNNYYLYKDIIDWCDRIECLKDIEFKRKVYHYVNNMKSIPICECGSYTKYRRIRDGYSKYCSDKCVKRSEYYQNKWKDSISKTFELGNKRRIETLINKYGNDYKEVIQSNRKSNMMNKYGVENVFQLDDVKNNRKNTLRDKYGSENYNNSDKTRNTRIKNGTQINDDIIDGFDEYRKVVINRTITIYRNNKDLINPNNLKRSKKLYHIDHLFSIKQGFLNNLPVEIISHPCNLHMIYYKENLVKQDSCWITKEELLNKIIFYDKDIKFKHTYLKECYSDITNIAKNLL